MLFDLLPVRNPNEQLFKSLQRINIDFKSNPSYLPTQETIGFVKETVDFNGSSSGYAASIYHLLTNIVLPQDRPEVQIDPKNRKISEVNELEYKMFPNPVSGSLFIQFFEDLETYDKIEIISSTGSKLIELDIRNNEKRIDVTNLTPGLYLVKIHYVSGIVKSEKIIVTN